MRWPVLLFTLAALSCVMPASARADLVYLKNGGVLEGKVTRKDGKIYIEQPTGTIVLPADKVEFIQEKETDLEVFERRFKAVDDEKDGAAETLFELGRWAEGKRLSNHATLAYRKVLQVDSEHEGARNALGYAKHKGVWMTQEEVNRARGLVKHKDAWVTPEAKEELTKIEAVKELEQTRVEIERLKLEQEQARADTERARADADRARADLYTNRDYYDRSYVAPVWWIGGGTTGRTPTGYKKVTTTVPADYGRVNIGAVTPHTFQNTRTQTQTVPTYGGSTTGGRR